MWALLLILGAATVGGILLTSGSAKAAAAAHIVGSRGWVETEPSRLSAIAGTSDSIYALASAMVSEAGSRAFAQTAVGWSIRNRAEERGETVYRLLTRAGHNDKATREFLPHASHGFYGPQNVGPRYASTREAPTDEALSLAADILAGAVDDPTGGATQFDSPTTQDTLLGKIEGYVKTAQQIAEERSRGSELVMIPGIENIRFWVPRSG